MKTQMITQKLIRKLGMVVITILISFTVYCQVPNKESYNIHQVGVSFGGLHSQLKDEIIAPLRWDGFGVVAKARLFNN